MHISLECNYFFERRKNVNREKGINSKDVYTIIGVAIIYLFGYVCPPFGGITVLGMKMLGVLIGLIFMTCTGCNIMASSLFALLAFVIHGYYDAGTLLATWVGSTTTFQIVFCGALCVVMRESGAMDVLAKKMLGSSICKGRPLKPYGFVFNEWLYMLIQILTWVGFDIIYVLCLKHIFKADMSELRTVDVANIESMKEVPDRFDFNMKVGLWSIAFCIAYIMVSNLLPKSDSATYKMFVSLGTSLIWALPLTIFSVFRKDGKPIFNAPVLCQKSSMWMMIALVGSMTMLGKVCTDKELGIRGWLVDIFTPLFGNMPIWLLLLIAVLFTTRITQLINGQVLTMGLTPVLGPIVCEMILNQGVRANPTVVLTVVSSCASVAFLTVSGSVNAAYLLGREEITQKFVWTKGLAVIFIYMTWQYLVALGAKLV